MSCIDPHGGELCDLILTGEELEKASRRALKLPAIVLNARQICDLELLLNGAFSPLKGFMDEEDYHGVLEGVRLSQKSGGVIWPIPITLDVNESFASKITTGQEVALKDLEGFPLAILNVSSKWTPNKDDEAHRVFGTTSLEHPGVFSLHKKMGPVYLGGKVSGLTPPRHYDFRHLRRTPKMLREIFKKLGAGKVVAFQTRNPMHRAHVELTRRAQDEVGAHLLIHPAVGVTKPGDVDYVTRVRCYERVLPQYKKDSVTLSLLPLAMRMGGPREAVWHAIIRKNYGCSHFIVGRDHAGPGKDSSGKPFYGPYDAQELLSQFEGELGVKMVPFKSMVYVKSTNCYVPSDGAPKDAQVAEISGTELRNLLQNGQEVPSYISYPEVITELRRTYPLQWEKGFTLFLTGLPASGKSTLANAIAIRLSEIDNRSVTLLDGDIIRTHLSTELGFSKEHRSLNVRRVGYVASEITKHGGIAICALIAPFEDDRTANREIVSQVGEYVEIHVKTPLSVCEERDPKGLYAKARQKLVQGVTGIDDPYQEPKTPELCLDMGALSVDQGVESIIEYLKARKLLRELVQ